MPINVTALSAQPLDVSADIAVIGVFTLPAAKGKEAPAPLKEIDAALGGGLAKLVAKEEFSGKRDQVLSFGTLGKVSYDRVVLVGLGDRAKVTDADLRAFGGKAARAANND